MTKLRKIISIIVFLLGVFFFIQAFFSKKEINHLWQKNKGILTDVLGEKTEHKKDKPQKKELINQLEDIKTQIVSQKFIEEANKKVNQIVNEKITKIKQVPEQQMEQVKKEIKKEIYQGLCENWLKKGD